MFFVHIPKSGGTYVSRILRKRRSHRPTRQLKDNMMVLRNPFDTYLSLYFFLTQQKSPFTIQRIARQCSLNEFIHKLLDPKELQGYHLRPIHNLQTNDYGMYTHYLMYLANPNKYTDVQSVLDFIQSDFTLLRFTHLTEDLHSLVISRNLTTTAFTHIKINASKRMSEEQLTDETIQLIKQKDKQVLETFYPELLELDTAAINKLFF